MSYVLQLQNKGTLRFTDVSLSGFKTSTQHKHSWNGSEQLTEHLKSEA